jgi:hypothetical protein
VNRQPSAPAHTEPAYQRPSLIEAEPVMFAVGLLLLVLLISLWRPVSQQAPQQAAPVEHSQTLAAAPPR